MVRLCGVVVRTKDNIGNKATTINSDAGMTGNMGVESFEGYGAMECRDQRKG